MKEKLNDGTVVDAKKCFMITYAQSIRVGGEEKTRFRTITYLMDAPIGIEFIGKMLKIENQALKKEFPDCSVNVAVMNIFHFEEEPMNSIY